MATIFSFFRKSEGLEEIIFKDRNKEYGSYALRKEQNSSLNQSSVITIGIALIMCILLIQQGKDSKSTADKESKTVVAVLGKIPAIELPIFRPPSPPDFVRHVRMSDFLVPIVVDYPDPNLQLTTNADIPTTIGDIDVISGIEPYSQDPIPIGENTNDAVFFVGEMPTFNGGDLAEFSKWIQNTIVYPQLAIDHEIEGRVIAEFIIGKQGQIEQITIMRGVDPLLDNEAIRVLKMSPLWKPGKQNGDPVRVKLVLPIVFNLNK